MALDRQQLTTDVAEILRHLHQVTEDYDYAAAIGYVRDSGQGEAVKGSGIQDPTGEVIVSRFHDSARSRVREALKAIHRSRLEAEKAARLLSQCFGPPVDIEAEDHSLSYIGPPISKAEYREAIKAQERRRARGEISA